MAGRLSNLLEDAITQMQKGRAGDGAPFWGMMG